MFGVVLWHCAQRENAVIWCEDQGELAYYEITQNGADDGTRIADLSVGDLWQFEVEACGGRRRVKQPLRLGCGPALAEHLLMAAKQFGGMPDQVEAFGTAINDPQPPERTGGPAADGVLAFPERIGKDVDKRKAG